MTSSVQKDDITTLVNTKYSLIQINSKISAHHVFTSVSHSSNDNRTIYEYSGPKASPTQTRRDYATWFKLWYLHIIIAHCVLQSLRFCLVYCSVHLRSWYIPQLWWCHWISCLLCPKLGLAYSSHLCVLADVPTNTI